MKQPIKKVNLTKLSRTNPKKWSQLWRHLADHPDIKEMLTSKEFRETLDIFNPEVYIQIHPCCEEILKSKEPGKLQSKQQKTQTAREVAETLASQSRPYKKIETIEKDLTN